MLIALDYDGTYTADPELWDQFIKSSKNRGHKIFVVTMRYEKEGSEVEIYLKSKVDRIIYTGRKAKLPYLQHIDIFPNIWIDDMPHFILHGADLC